MLSHAHACLLLILAFATVQILVIACTPAERSTLLGAVGPGISAVAAVTEEAIRANGAGAKPDPTVLALAAQYDVAHKADAAKLDALLVLARRKTPCPACNATPCPPAQTVWLQPGATAPTSGFVALQPADAGTDAR